MESWVQLVPSNVQVSFRGTRLVPIPPANPPKSTTSLPSVAAVAKRRAGGGFETGTWVQLVPSNVQVSSRRLPSVPPKSTTSLPSVAIAAKSRAGGGFDASTEPLVQLVPLNVHVSFRTVERARVLPSLQTARPHCPASPSKAHTRGRGIRDRHLGPARSVERPGIVQESEHLTAREEDYRAGRRVAGVCRLCTFGGPIPAHDVAVGAISLGARRLRRGNIGTSVRVGRVGAATAAREHKDSLKTEGRPLVRPLDEVPTAHPIALLAPRKRRGPQLNFGY